MAAHTCGSRLCAGRCCPAAVQSKDGGAVKHLLRWEQLSTSSDVAGLRRQSIPTQLSLRMGEAVCLHLQATWEPAACRRCTRG
jgi:hypothetical protein